MQRFFLSNDEPDPGRNTASCFKNKTKDADTSHAHIDALQAAIRPIQLSVKSIWAFWPLRQGHDGGTSERLPSM